MCSGVSLVVAEDETPSALHEMGRYDGLVHIDHLLRGALPKPDDVLRAGQGAAGGALFASKARSPSIEHQLEFPRRHGASEIEVSGVDQPAEQIKARSFGSGGIAGEKEENREGSVHRANSKASAIAGQRTPVYESA